MAMAGSLDQTNVVGGKMITQFTCVEKEEQSLTVPVMTHMTFLSQQPPCCPTNNTVGPQMQNDAPPFVVLS